MGLLVDGSTHAIPPQARYPNLSQALKGLRARGMRWRCWTAKKVVEGTAGYPETTRERDVFVTVSSNGSVRILDGRKGATVLLANDAAEAALFEFGRLPNCGAVNDEEKLTQLEQMYPQLGSRVA